MAVLYYNPRTYESFDMTVEYATTKGYSDWVAFFGFGATMGRSWMDADSKGDTAFILHPGGLLLNAKTKGWYAGNAVSDQVRNAGGTWNAEGVHTLRLRVNGVSFKVWIDGYELTGGSITIDGQDIRQVTLRSLRGQVGIVQQDVMIFAGTVMFFTISMLSASVLSVGM